MLSRSAQRNSRVNAPERFTFRKPFRARGTCDEKRGVSCHARRGSTGEFARCGVRPGLTLICVH
jgi:hypothetical protein